MKWLILLYPSWWRSRYKEEFLALVKESGLSVRDVLDVVLGAIVARFHPAGADAGSPPERGGRRSSVVLLSTRMCVALLVSFVLIAFVQGPVPWSYSDGAPYQPRDSIHLRTVSPLDILDYAFGRVHEHMPVTRAVAMRTAMSTMKQTGVNISVREAILAYVYESTNLNQCWPAQATHGHQAQVCSAQRDGHVYWVLHIVERPTPSKNPAQLIFIDARTGHLTDMRL